MLNPFEKKRMKQNLIKEIKEEFPKEEKQDPLDNKIELLHRGLDEGNNIYVRDFLLEKSEFNIAEPAIVDDKNKKEIQEATDAKARALALYNRWIKL